MTLPTGVTIQGFRPATTSIRLEPVIEKQVEVEVKFEGKLPEGYEVKSVSTSTSQVRVTRPFRSYERRPKSADRNSMA